ncbi:HAD family hydrolase [Brachybacterium tyrofermentans]|uniref:HAD family hydrolase n=1 Tax=Brachybacterium tyrofermentans TaxID=47848 RepID=UPI000A1AEFE7|nr:HAD family hydrolase [Brachybacterium tyrofermentans]SLN02718.1 Cof-like hydrolase [Corynebacterium xerosis]
MILDPGRRIVFLDVDGTIIAHDGILPTSTVDAIRSARAAGHRVLLATGRSPSELDPRLAEIGFDGAVLGAGAFVHLGEDWVVQHAMPVAKARRMIEVFGQLDLDYVLQARDGVYPVASRREEMRRMLGIEDRPGLGTGEELDIEQVAEKAPLDAIAKAIFLGVTPDAFERVHQALTPEGFSVITGTITHLGTGGGEVSLAGVNKGSAILALLDQLGLDVADSIGIGDNNNDLEMLRITGVGIAMGEATPEARAAADEITGTVHQSGIAQAFARHGLLDGTAPEGEGSATAGAAQR